MIITKQKLNSFTLLFMGHNYHLYLIITYWISKLRVKRKAAIKRKMKNH